MATPRIILWWAEVIFSLNVTSLLCLFLLLFLGSVGVLGSMSHPSNSLSTQSKLLQPLIWFSPKTNRSKYLQGWWLAGLCAALLALWVKVFLILSSQGSRDSQVCNKWENKGMLFCVSVQLMAQTVTQGQEDARLQSHYFCVGSSIVGPVAASVCECVCVFSVLKRPWNTSCWVPSYLCVYVCAF